MNRPLKSMHGIYPSLIKAFLTLATFGGAELAHSSIALAFIWAHHMAPKLFYRVPRSNMDSLCMSNCLSTMGRGALELVIASDSTEHQTLRLRAFGLGCRADPLEQWAEQIQSA